MNGRLTKMKATNLREKFIVGKSKLHATIAGAARLAKAVVDGVGKEKHLVIAIVLLSTFWRWPAKFSKATCAATSIWHPVQPVS
jgi:hypothetical protein